MANIHMGYQNGNIFDWSLPLRGCMLFSCATHIQHIYCLSCGHLPSANKKTVYKIHYHWSDTNSVIMEEYDVAKLYHVFKYGIFWLTWLFWCLAAQYSVSVRFVCIYFGICIYCTVLFPTFWKNSALTKNMLLHPYSCMQSMTARPMSTYIIVWPKLFRHHRWYASSGSLMTFLSLLETSTVPLLTLPTGLSSFMAVWSTPTLTALSKWAIRWVLGRAVMYELQKFTKEYKICMVGKCCLIISTLFFQFCLYRKNRNLMYLMLSCSVARHVIILLTLTLSKFVT